MRALVFLLALIAPAACDHVVVKTTRELVAALEDRAVSEVELGTSIDLRLAASRVIEVDRDVLITSSSLTIVFDLANGVRGVVLARSVQAACGNRGSGTSRMCALAAV
jgi:hypothetical protein